MNLDYLDAIQLNHSVVSFSPAKSIFYISLWNGVLRDGRIDDIDITFLEAKHPKIINNSLSFDNKNISLTPHQLKHLSLLFPQLQ
jgi:hypothetical protein